VTTSSPATRLLFASAAAAPSESAIDQALAAGVDWSELCALAAHENAANVLVQRLGRPGSVTSDQPGYQDLRRLAATSLMRMLQLERALDQTLDALGGRGIDVMLLKGAGLAYTAYPSFAERPMNDLDLLVRTDQAEAVWDLLQTNGWVWPAARWAAERYTALHHLPPLLREPGGFRLEIHRHILPDGHPFAFTAADLWTGARHITRGVRHLTVPSVTHQLWHVAVHFAWSHGLEWGAWRALRDTAAIVGTGQLPWNEFVSLARASRAQTCCYWTLRLTRRLTGAAIPDHVLSSLKPPRADSLLEHLERHYVSSFFPSEQRCPSLWLAQRLWEAGILPRWSGHRSARPWQVDERWAAGGAAPAPARGRLGAFWAALRKLPTAVAYWRRIRRFALPATP
jgi:hypothetical protein